MVILDFHPYGLFTGRKNAQPLSHATSLNSPKLTVPNDLPGYA